MKDNEITNIEFRINGVLEYRWVLEPHCGAMHRMEERMRDAGCEPVLVVDRDCPNAWWSDDLTFIADGIFDKLDDITVMTHDVVWRSVIMASEYLAKPGDALLMDVLGTKLEARASSVPMDEKTGVCTNDCEPVEL